VFIEEIRHLLRRIAEDAAVKHHRSLVFGQVIERRNNRAPTLPCSDNLQGIIFVIAGKRLRHGRQIAFGLHTYVLTPKVLQNPASGDA
jgi:hypothetical protein